MLTGDYAVVTCDEFGCLPETTKDGAYVVFDEATKALNEPYSGQGDMDGDLVSNLGEYINAITNGGGVRYFMVAATDPTRDGAESLSERADIDRDGGVGATDVQFVINAALGIDIGCLFADINIDDDIDAVDVQLGINAALGMI